MNKYFLILLLFIAGCQATTSTTSTSSLLPNYQLPPFHTEKVAPPTKGTAYIEPTIYAETPLDIKVKVKGYKEGGTAKLIGQHNEKNWLASEVEIDAQGQFQFSEEKGIASGLYYVLLPNDKNFALLLDKDQQFEVLTNIDDLTGSVEVKGSEENQLFYEFSLWEGDWKGRYSNASEGKDAQEGWTSEQQILLTEKRQKFQKLVDKHPNSLFTRFKIAGQNPTINRQGLSDVEYVALYKKHFWDNVDLSDERLLRTPVIQNKLKRYLQDLTPKQADSLWRAADYITEKSLAHPEVFLHVANWIPLTWGKKPVFMGSETVYVNMVDKYFTQDLAFWSKADEIKGLRKEIREFKPSLLGKKGQNIVALDQHGKSHSMHDLAGDLIVLFMYSTTCEHCREAAPKMTPIYEKWQPKGVNFYGICLDGEDQRKDWEQFLAQYKMPFVNVIDPHYDSGYHRKYHMDITPEIYVLDKRKDYKIIAKDMKPHQLTTIFERHL